MEYMKSGVGFREKQQQQQHRLVMMDALLDRGANCEIVSLIDAAGKITLT